MASSREIEELKALERAGLWEELARRAGQVLDADDKVADEAVFAIVERASESSSEVALIAGMAALRFGRPDAEKTSIVHLRRAARSEHPETSSIANFVLSSTLATDELSWAEAAARMEEAADLGDPAAKAAFGRVRISGTFGIRADVEDGEYWLSSAVEDGSLDGCHELAVHMMESQRAVDDYNPLQLLMHAAGNGHERSRKLLFEMGLGDDDAHDPMLPYPVVPDGSRRPVALLKCLKSRFEMEDEHARSVVAALHGFPDWGMLQAAYSDQARRKGKFDEECGADEMTERARLQVSVLQHSMHMPPHVAAAFVEVARPTSMSEAVSFEGFEEAVLRRRRSMTVEDMEDAMKSMMRMIMSDISGRRA